MPSKWKSVDRATFIEDYMKWIEDPLVRKSRLKDPVDEIRERMSSDLTFEKRCGLATRMAYIGGFYLSEGAIRCFHESPEGWRLMKRGLLYRHWNHRISARARDFWSPRARAKGAFAEVSSLAEVAALGLPLATSEAIWTLEVMELGLTDGRVRWRDRDYFAAFVMRLDRKRKRQEDIPDLPPDAEPWEHPFGDLIDHWDDEAQLAEAIRRMCDYHLHWNYGDTEEHDAEFSSPYAMVNPIEIHALRAVREALGLPMPEVDHELLQPPLYPVPEFAKSITTDEILQEDDLLREIVERNQAWCDGLEE